MEISKNLKERIASFFKLKKVVVSNWDELKVGEIYHVPPLLVTKRFDFILMEKQSKLIRVKKIGSSHLETIYRTDIISNFIVSNKRHERNNTKEKLC